MSLNSAKYQGKKEALWDQIFLSLWASLPIIHFLHSVVACADIKLIRSLWLFQGQLTIPHPAQICATSSTSRASNGSTSVLGIGEISGHSYFCLNEESNFKYFPPDRMQKRRQNVMYLYFTCVFRSIQERHFALHIFRLLDDL